MKGSILWLIPLILTSCPFAQGLFPWGTFGGDIGRTFTSDSTLNTDLYIREVWSVPVSGELFSTDSEGNAYVMDGNGAVTCVTKDGFINWSYQADGTTHGKSPLVIEDGRICFSTSEGKVYSLLNGVEEWVRTFPPKYGRISSPILWSNGDIVVCLDNGTLAWISPKGQVTRYASFTRGSMMEPIAVDSSFNVISHKFDGTVVSCDKNGKPKWEYFVGGEVYSIAVGKDDRVYVGHKKGLTCFHPNGTVAYDDKIGAGNPLYVSVADNGSAYVAFTQGKGVSLSGLLMRYDGSGHQMWVEWTTMDPTYPLIQRDGTILVSGDEIEIYDPLGDLIWKDPDFPYDDIQSAVVLDHRTLMFLSGGALIRYKGIECYPPVNLTAESTVAGVELKWDPYDDHIAGFVGYAIYRSEYGETSQLAMVSREEFKDTTALDRTRYEYRVSTVILEGESFKSEPVQIYHRRPFVPKYADLYGVLVRAESVWDGIKIMIDLNVPNGSCVEECVVTKDPGNRSKSVSPLKNWDFEYLDRDVTDGEDYNYAVRVRFSDGSESLTYTGEIHRETLVDRVSKGETKTALVILNASIAMVMIGLFLINFARIRAKQMKDISRISNRPHDR